MNLDTSPHHHAFRLLLRDLHRLLEFVEPVDANASTYSHRIFELFLRTCTEFEALCKHLLSVEGYVSTEREPERWDGRDYQTLAANRPLTQRQVRVYFWRRRIIEPFRAWKNNQPLPWYQSYNIVKHNRHEEFKRANLETLVDALAGLFELLALADPYPKFEEDWSTAGHGRHEHFSIDEFRLECAGFDGTVGSGTSEDLAARTTAS